MFDDGQHGDGVASDGTYGATIPPQPNDTVVEFFLEAVDRLGLTNRWPALPLQPRTRPIFRPDSQCLYQVDGSSYASAQPFYKLILLESERAELASIPCTASQDSDPR